MYKILTNGKQSIKRYFLSYEAARSYVRKLMRKRGVVDLTGNRNPPIWVGGYSIKPF